ncbi:hypothetical protein [Streptomyces noursei]|uniref:hypothetical protein n=1 Tax=Streptomyces noursei TaxID=1971 RepID=UPI0035D75B28
MKFSQLERSETEDHRRPWRLEGLRASLNGPMNDRGQTIVGTTERKKSSESRQMVSGGEPEAGTSIPTADPTASA